MRHFFRLFILIVPAVSHIAFAAETGIRVFTSNNAESNALRSFIVVPAKHEIPHGISKQTKVPVLKKQPPFRIEILDPVGEDQTVQWVINITNNYFGRIRVKSDYRC